MRLTATSAQHRHQGSRAAALAALALRPAAGAALRPAAGAAAAEERQRQRPGSARPDRDRGDRRSGAGNAVDTLGNSLALLGARYRIEHGETGGGAPPTRPRPSAPPWEEGGEIDPSKLPPASAGTNGTHVPHTSALSRDEIFAHTRGGGESTAILLSGIALAPPDAPEAVKNVINNANTIVGRPYVWGGGHGSWYSTATTARARSASPSSAAA